MLYLNNKYCVPDEKEQFQQIVLYDMLHFFEEMRRTSKGGGWVGHTLAWGMEKLKV